MSGRRRTWMAAVIAVTAVAAVSAATSGFATSLAVTSGHLTTLASDVSAPPGPTCSVGDAVDDHCEVTLTAAGDAYVSNHSQARGTSFGDGPSLLTNPHAPSGSPGNNHLRSFLRFDIPALPAEATLDTATVTLHRSSPLAARSYRLDRVAGSWNESTINWNDQPGVTSGTSRDSTASVAAGSVTWQVSGDVQAFLDAPATNHGWRLIDLGTDQTESSFASSEAGSNHPTLVLTYTP